MSRFLERLGVMPVLLLGTSLFGIGLMSLGHIVDNWWPFDVARLDLIRATAVDRVDAASLLEAADPEIILAFLAAILVMTTGLMLPLTYVLNKRFSITAGDDARSLSSPRFLVMLRQSMWVGTWIAFCVWLQMNRSFGLAISALVAGVLIMFEVLLQVKTRATDIGR